MHLQVIDVEFVLVAMVRGKKAGPPCRSTIRKGLQGGAVRTGLAETCPLCYQNEVKEWIEIQCCRQQFCLGCLENVVRTCPSEIQKYPRLELFEPEKDPAQRHGCPYCRVPFSPATKVLHRGMVDNVTTQKMWEISSLVIIPCAFQSFDSQIPACIFTMAEYRTAQGRFEEYRRRVSAEAVRRSQERAHRPVPWVPRMPPLQAPYIDVMDVVFFFVKNEGSKTEDGVSVQECVSRLPRCFSDFCILEALEDLVREGYIYSTIDEDHFKSAL